MDTRRIPAKPCLPLLVLLAACPPAGDSDTPAPGDTEAPHPDDTGTPVDWPAGLMAFEPIRVLDAAGVRTERAVVILGDEIYAEVSAGQDWPPDTTVLDGTGLTLLPGLIDSHVHMAHGGTTYWVGDTVGANLRASLYWGVTSVVDVGGPLWLTDLRDGIVAGRILGPEMRVTGPFLTAVLSHPCETADDPDLCWYVDGDGAEKAQELLDAGVDYLKTAYCDADFTPWPNPRLDLGDLADIVDASGSALVLAHIDQIDDATDVLSVGVDVLAHPPFDVPLADASSLMGAMAMHTTINLAGGVVRMLIDLDDLDTDRYNAVPDAVVDAWRYLQQNQWVFDPAWVEGSQIWRDATAGSIYTAVADGIPMAAGSDGGYYFVPHGAALHDEIAILVEAGMTPVQAITAATALPAELRGWDDRGWVAAGYRADLLVVRGNPAQDIDQTRQVEWVVRAGEVWSPDQILQADAVLYPAGSGLGGFCLADADCDEGLCDLFAHQCAAACSPTYISEGACDAASWCMPQDAVATTVQGVCHQETPCDLYLQDCEPAEYAESCLPADTDTNYCFPSGEADIGERCSYDDPGQRCAPGLFCDWLTDYRCRELCDPSGVDTCSTGRCHQMYAAQGSPWFGMCY